MMLVTGGALLLGAGAVTNYLLAQQPQTAQEELTLANLEAIAFLDSEELDMDKVTKSCTKAQQAGYDTKGAINGILCDICCNTYYIRPTGSGTCSPF